MPDETFDIAHKFWCELVDKWDDETYKAHPDHCLITFDELHDYIKRAIAAQK